VYNSFENAIFFQESEGKQEEWSSKRFYLADAQGHGDFCF
jgi:hypothetical protein